MSNPSPPTEPGSNPNHSTYYFNVDRIARLEAICGAAYQMAGVLNAPERFMDALALHDEYMHMTPEQIIDKLLPVRRDEPGCFPGEPGGTLIRDNHFTKADLCISHNRPYSECVRLMGAPAPERDGGARYPLIAKLFDLISSDNSGCTA